MFHKKLYKSLAENAEGQRKVIEALERNKAYQVTTADLMNFGAHWIRVVECHDAFLRSKGLLEEFFQYANERGFKFNKDNTESKG